MKFLSKTKEPVYFYRNNALGERTLKPGSSYAYDEAGHLIGDYMLGGTLGREILWLGDLPIAVIQAKPEETPLDSPARTGTWALAKQPPGASLGSFYRNDPGTGAATAQWAIPQAVSGRYRLYARWVEAPSHSAAARYTVIHAGGANVISADQRQNGGRWNLLGTFNFTPGANHRVVLTNSSDGAVIADAIKVVPDNLAPNIGNIHSDHLGTPRLIEDHSGKTVWRWDHLDPFGANPANEDPDGDGVKFVFNLRFPGQVFDKETRMHYNYFRDYDPTTGRYIQSDPIGLRGGVNTFGYVGQNLLSYTDPTGTIVFLPVLAAALTYGGAAWSGWSVGYYGTRTVQSFQSMTAIQNALLLAQDALAKCLARNGGLPCAACKMEEDLVASLTQSLTSMGANTAGSAAYTLYSAIGGAAVRTFGLLRAAR
jgi:RHS repeat-associated protein